MKKFSSILLGLFFLFFTSSIQAFTDDSLIPEWATEAVEVLVDEGIINGNADGSFAPLESVNRAEFCKIIVLATDTPLVSAETSSFPDVPSDAWFFGYVETAKSKGWIDGYPDGNFDPSGAINRAEIAKIIVRAFGFDVQDPYPTDQWYMPYLRSLNNKNLLPHGEDFLTMDAAVNASRAEVVEQIYRVMLQAELVVPKKTDKKEDEIQPSTTYISPVLAPLESVLSANSGNLKIKRKKGINQKIYVYSNEKDVDALHLLLSAEKGPVRVSEFQFRIIGSGKFSDFSQAWLEIDGKSFSSRVLIGEELVRIPLRQDLTIPSKSTRELVLKVDLSGKGKKGTSSRFVLYLPQWIAADTATKVGFFPFGGEDLEIKN